MKHLQSKFFLITIGLLINTHLFSNNQTEVVTLSDEAIIATYQGKDSAWQYLEYKFIIEPNNKINYIMRHASTGTGFLGAATLGCKLLTNKHPELSSKNLLNNLVITFSSLATFHSIYNFIHCYIKRMVKQQTLEEILQNWDIHRKYFPIQFIDTLDELFTLYQEHGKSALNTTNVCQLFNLIEHHLEHHFTDRYKKDKTTENQFANLKSLTEVLSNLK